jgi:hypothetical protein
MKKIKLIKLYPGSPNNLGITLTPKVDIDNNDANNFYWGGSWFNPNHYPEFWEEVVELNYEIVVMKTLMGVVLEYEDGVCVKRSDTICPSNTNKLQDCLRGNRCTIYSIKRLSDGEVFTITNKVQFMDTKSVNGFITKFEIVNGRILVTYGNQTSNLDSLVLVKLTTFKTEDGVDVFEGGKVWYVRKDLTYNNSFIVSNNCFVVGENLYFSKKELMKNYIRLNTRCLSLNDVLRNTLNELDRMVYKRLK